jgi:hypothetical protein
MSLPWGAISQSQGVVHDIGGLVSTGRRNTDKQTTPPPAHLLPSDGEDESESDTDRDETVARLARTLTQHSVKDVEGQYVNPFEGTEDPSLDPNSGSFNTRVWIKTLIGIASRDPERYPSRVSGISYRNLNVHGFGEPTDYQKTFGNYPLAISSLFNKFKSGGGKAKIQILRNFDGLIKSGEMLVVLGRPGRHVS